MRHRRSARGEPWQIRSASPGVSPVRPASQLRAEVRISSGSPRHGADRGQHYRCRHLQPADLAGVLRADHFGLDGADHRGRTGARAAVRRPVTAPAGRRRAVRVRAGSLRQSPRVHERLVVLDHRLGWQRGDRGRLGPVRRVTSSTPATPSWITVLLVLVGLWIPAAINLSGVKNMGSVQVVTTVVKFAALAFMSTVGLFFIKQRQLHALERQQARARSTRSAAGWPSRCSATSASRPPPSPPRRCATPTATSPGPPCWARSRPPWSTCSR